MQGDMYAVKHGCISLSTFQIWGCLLDVVFRRRMHAAVLHATAMLTMKKALYGFRCMVFYACGYVPPCIRLASREFNLTDQDSAEGKILTFLKSM